MSLDSDKCMFCDGKWPVVEVGIRVTSQDGMVSTWDGKAHPDCIKRHVRRFVRTGHRVDVYRPAGAGRNS